MNNKLFQKIARKGSKKEIIADEVVKNPEMISVLFEGLNTDKASIKYGCEKILHFISEKNPEVLYPHFGFFIKMLDCKNNILKWGAITIIANLTRVDLESKFERIFDKYFSFINGPVMISAANTIRNAAKIVIAKPHLAEKIVQEILKVEYAHYQTSECVNVACGHTIDSLSKIYEQVQSKDQIVKFIQKQLKNTRASVRKRAEKFLKKYKIPF